VAKAQTEQSDTQESRSAEHLSRIRIAEYAVEKYEREVRRLKEEAKDAKKDLGNARALLRKEIHDDQPRLPFPK
jgi:hypothetical protein